MSGTPPPTRPVLPPCGTTTHAVRCAGAQHMRPPRRCFPGAPRPAHGRASACASRAPRRTGRVVGSVSTWVAPSRVRAGFVQQWVCSRGHLGAAAAVLGTTASARAAAAGRKQHADTSATWAHASAASIPHPLAGHAPDPSVNVQPHQQADPAVGVQPQLQQTRQRPRQRQHLDRPGADCRCGRATVPRPGPATIMPSSAPHHQRVPGLLARPCRVGKGIGGGSGEVDTSGAGA
jgi:hypothetical protein